MICSNCRKEIKNHGHSGAPLFEGKVCDKCNSLVLKVRQYLLGGNKTEALQLKTNGVLTFYKPEDPKEFSLKEMQSLVGGYIQLYPTKKIPYFIICDEEGIQNNKEYNLTAKIILGFDVVGDIALIPKELFK